MTTKTPKVQGYNSGLVPLRDVRRDSVVAYEGRPLKIMDDTTESTGSNYVYVVTGYFLDEPAQELQMKGPGYQKVCKLYAVPEVGDGAFSVVGSDRYPYTVTKVSKSGATIEVRRCRARVVSGSWTVGPRPVIEYEETDQESEVARWSRSKGCFVTPGGSRIVTGERSYYQDPHS